MFGIRGGWVSYETDQERVEAIKKWWKENGKAVIVGVVLGIGILAGGRGWMDYQRGQAEQASVRYGELIAAAERNDTALAVAQGEHIIDQYGRTPYGALSGLVIARLKLEEGDAAAARAYLEQVMQSARQEELRQIARLRLGRLLLGEGDADGALALVAEAGGRAEPFRAAYEELRGDALLAKGQVEEARSAYRNALALLAPTADRRALLQLKLDDLGGTQEEQLS
jgi:predicted negative regulator of RcsB-dependent stress response